MCVRTYRGSHVYACKITQVQGISVPVFLPYMPVWGRGAEPTEDPRNSVPLNRDPCTPPCPHPCSGPGCWAPDPCQAKWQSGPASNLVWTQGPAADQLSLRPRIYAPHTLSRVGRRMGVATYLTRRLERSSWS